MPSNNGFQFFSIHCHFLIIFSMLAPFAASKALKPGRVEDASFWMNEGQSHLKNVLLHQENNGLAKNVILFIGDGMGISSNTAARIYKGQKQGKSGEESKMIWETFPSTGFSKTYDTSNQVSDSASTATAMFTGVKSRSSMMRLDATAQYNVCDYLDNETKKLKTLIHSFMEGGKETGFVTTTRITHATPGSLYAISNNRYWESDSDMPSSVTSNNNSGCRDIAHQLIYDHPGNDIKVILGGGGRNFRLSKNTIHGGSRNDEDLIEVWKRLKSSKNSSFSSKSDNYGFLSTPADLRQWIDDMESSKKLSPEFVLGIFADNHLPYSDEISSGKHPDSPTLEQMTKAAILRLQGSEKGYFLMVEGGRIDHAHHQNQAKRAFEETLNFEDAVQAAYDATSREDTLIVVTADHSHSMTINGYPPRGNSIFGFVYNPEVDDVLINFDGSIQPYSTISYANGPGFYDHVLNDTTRMWRDIRNMDVESYEYRMPTAFTRIGYETHGGEDVAIYAIGPVSHIFNGVHEQSYIFHAINYAACLDASSKCERIIASKTNGGTKYGSDLKTIVMGIFVVTPLISHFFKYFLI